MTEGEEGKLDEAKARRSSPSVDRIVLAVRRTRATAQ
jgi:hypothetical protein